MTKGKSRPSSKGGNNDSTGSRSTKRPSVEWVNPTPNDADRTWLTDHRDKHNELVFSLLDQLSDDDKLSVKFDTYTSRWLAIYFAGDSDDENKGCALSVRGSSPYSASVLLAYYHLVLFQGSWGHNPSGNEGEWG
jgi:hypothetical protein